MNTFLLSQLKEIHEMLGLPSQVSHARGRIEGLIATAEVDEAEECEHDLVVESTSDFYGNDTGKMNCCKKCNHQEPIVNSSPDDRYDDSLSYA